MPSSSHGKMRHEIHLYVALYRLLDLANHYGVMDHMQPDWMIGVQPAECCYNRQLTRLPDPSLLCRSGLATVRLSMFVDCLHLNESIKFNLIQCHASYAI